MCKSPTRIEKMSGATYMLKTFSDHEECRKCLDPGLKRRCCGNYYCDDCFYSTSQCPSCETAVGRSGLTGILKGRVSIISVLLGWLALVFFLLTFAAIVIFVSVSEAQTPDTLSHV